jgi:hypothetical protein
MVGHEDPGVEAGTAFENQGGEPVEEVLAVVIGAEDLTAFDAVHDGVVEGTRAIEVRAAGHLGGGSPNEV